jgi:WW domain-containing oxidoreductase
MSLIELFKSNGPSGFGYGSTAEQVSENLSLVGKTILITGVNSGLGFEAMRVLAMRGAHVIGTARTEQKARDAANQVQGKVTGVACELADPKSVQSCVETVKRMNLKLDAIICNAGIMALPKLEKAFGYELQFFTNHIGHFILVTGLTDSLAETGRVVMLSSDAHRAAPKGGIAFDNLSGEKSYGAWSAYGQSKMANILFAKELSRRFNGTKKTANALHPGVIKTNLARNMNPLAGLAFQMIGPIFLKTIAQGAATEVYVAVNPGVAGVSGEYFSDSNVAKPRFEAEDAALATKLWSVSEEIVRKVLAS